MSSIFKHITICCANWISICAVSTNTKQYQNYTFPLMQQNVLWLLTLLCWRPQIRVQKCTKCRLEIMLLATLNWSLQRCTQTPPANILTYNKKTFLVGNHELLIFYISPVLSVSWLHCFALWNVTTQILGSIQHKACISLEVMRTEDINGVGRSWYFA